MPAQESPPSATKEEINQAFIKALDPLITRLDKLECDNASLNENIGEMKRIIERVVDIETQTLEALKSNLQVTVNNTQFAEKTLDNIDGLIKLDHGVADLIQSNQKRILSIQKQMTIFMSILLGLTLGSIVMLFWPF